MASVMNLASIEKPWYGVTFTWEYGGIHADWVNVLGFLQNESAPLFCTHQYDLIISFPHLSKLFIKSLKIFGTLSECVYAPEAMTESDGEILAVASLTFLPWW